MISARRVGPPAHREREDDAGEGQHKRREILQARGVAGYHDDDGGHYARGDHKQGTDELMTLVWLPAHGHPPRLGQRCSRRQQRRSSGAGSGKPARQVLDGSTAKAMMNKFRSLGILDPADQEHHAQFTYGSNDFALVTMARNPWSADGRYRAVICGGIHGPGTAWALRELLTHPDRFTNHPLGAVLEVKPRLDLD